jgi:alanine racemase
VRIRPSIAVINLDHLRSNLRQLKKLLPPGADWIPMVKADGYGHGAVEVGRILRQEGVKALGVSLVEEGIELREAGDKGQIVVFGTFETHGEQIVKHHLTPVLSTFIQIETLRPHLKNDLVVHLKLNTGMNRLGFMLDELSELKQHLRLTPQIKIEAIMTHLHSGEDADTGNGATQKQFLEFTKRATEFLPDSHQWHIWSTSALLKRQGMKAAMGKAWPEAWEKMGARPGLALYGAAAFATDVALEPVMTFKSQICKINILKAGETAGYGATFQARGESTLGVVPVGYADGYHRSLSNVGIVLVNGERAAVVGRVSMDFLLVELTHLTRPVEIGAEVVLFGESMFGPRLGVEEVGDLAGIIAWEMLTSVSKRVPREYVGGGQL